MVIGVKVNLAEFDEFTRAASDCGHKTAAAWLRSLARAELARNPAAEVVELMEHSPVPQVGAEALAEEWERVNEVKSRSWSELMGQEDASEYFEAVEQRGIRKWPPGFRDWDAKRKAAWLDENHPLGVSK